MDLDIYPDQPASVTILGSTGGQAVLPVRLVSASWREIVVAATPLALTEGSMVKLDCSPYLILGRVAAVQRNKDEDQVRLEVRHVLSEANLRLIREKWF